MYIGPATPTTYNSYGCNLHHPAHQPRQRWMMAADLGSDSSRGPVLQAEQAGAVEPWCEEDFRRLLRQTCCGRVSVLGANTIDEQVTGHMVYRLHHRHVTVLRLLTAPAFRRRGATSPLLDYLRSRLHVDRRCRLLLDVPEHQDDLLACCVAHGRRHERQGGHFASWLTRATAGDRITFEYAVGADCFGRGVHPPAAEAADVYIP